MTEIAKCPYCGSYPKIEYCTSYLGRTFDYQVQCQVCGAIGPQKDIPEAAIEAWNQVAGLQEKLEALQNEQDYDPGFINDYGGGDVGWWQDYIRHEVNRCNEYWRSLIE